MSDIVLAAHWTEQRKCLHNRRGYVRLITANGVEQIRKGCLECGFTPLPSLPYREHPDRTGYPVVKPHPAPCDCHDDRSAEPHHSWPRTDYDAYLRSAQWAERRTYFVARALGRCQLCNHPGGPGGTGLNVHHRTYERLGCELDTDVIVLCRACHEHHHLRIAAAA